MTHTAEDRAIWKDRSFAVRGVTTTPYCNDVRLSSPMRRIDGGFLLSRLLISGPRYKDSFRKIIDFYLSIVAWSGAGVSAIFSWMQRTFSLKVLSGRHYSWWNFKAVVGGNALQEIALPVTRSFFGNLVTHSLHIQNCNEERTYVTYFD